MKTKILLSVLPVLNKFLKTSLVARLLLILALCLAPCALRLATAQVPQGFNYQAIARDNSGNPIVSETIDVKLGIQADTSAIPVILWEEIHTGVKTNAFGLFTVILGQGTKTDGSAATFKDVNWSVIPLYLKTQINYKSSWKYMGSSKLWSVPYALVANDLGGPVKKLAVNGSTTVMDEALFEVKNKTGQTVFAVYNEGVRVYVDNGSKGLKGGFAIGGFGTDKGISDPLFVVNADSIRGYIKQNPVKGLKGGFAIGSFDPTKAYNYEEYLQVTRDSSRIYVKESAKGLKGGFAIGSFNPTKGGTITPFTSLNPDNYFIGERSGIKNTSGIHNSFVGYETGINNTSGRKNVFLGFHAGMSNDTASYNVFIGNESGTGNKFGRYNTFLGFQSGYTNNNADNNVLLGFRSGFNNNAANNVFVGVESGYSNTTGTQNDMMGYQAGRSNQGGLSNVLIGTQAGYSNISGSYNVMIGHMAGYSNSASYNTFLGYQSGKANSTGQFNVFLGYNAGLTNNSGASNIFIGNQAGYLNTVGNYNVFLGTSAGYSSTGYDNVFLGYESGYSNSASQSVFIGYQSGRSNTSGFDNVFIGNQSGYTNTSGAGNVALGYMAGFSNSTGNYNVFLGDNAGYYNTTAYDNIFIGHSAGRHTAGGYSNAIIGSLAGANNTEGRWNTILGNYAGYSNTTGNYNTILGSNTGYKNTTGSYNVFIGNSAGYNETGSYKLYLDVTTTTSPLIYGDFSSRYLIFNGNVGIGTTIPSQKLEVNGNIQISSNGYGIWLRDETTGTNWQVHSHGDVLRMYNGSVETIVGTQTSSRRWKDSIKPMENMLGKINQLQGVTFTWKPGYGKGGNDLGFIAEDVGKVFPELVTYEKNGVDAVALNYPVMTAIAIEGIKELSKKNTLMEDQIANQQKQIESYKSENDNLKSQLQIVQEKVEQIEALLAKGGVK